MLLTLKEAATRAEMPQEKLIFLIDSGVLKASKISKEGSKTFMIDSEELTNFLKNKSFGEFWDETETAENEAVDSPTQLIAGNLRRVLTAEAVSNLKIEHQVLASRVETLEHLFSEFMDLSKTEPTLLLEDEWKIQQTTVEKQNLILDKENGEAGVVQQSTPIQNLNNTDLKATGSNSETLATRQETTAGSETTTIQDINAGNTDSTTNVIESAKEVGKEDVNYAQSESERMKTLPSPSPESTAEKGELKEQSAKDLLSKKLNAISEKKLNDEEIDKVNQKDTNDTKLVRSDSIDAKLAEYERRLADAKRTATQMWH